MALLEKKQKIYRERNEERRKRFVDFVNMMPKKRLVFVDESGFDEFLQREYGRAKRGEKLMAEISGKRFERQSIVGAKRDKEILAPFGYSGTCDTELFNFWLKTQLVPHLRKGQIVILDNASRDRCIIKQEVFKNYLRDIKEEV